jgi:hypothetical protein
LYVNFNLRTEYHSADVSDVLAKKKYWTSFNVVRSVVLHYSIFIASSLTSVSSTTSVDTLMAATWMDKALCMYRLQGMASLLEIKTK